MQLFSTTTSSTAATSYVQSPSADEERPPPPPTWVDKHMPAWLVPYMKIARIDRPIGTYLLFYPCAASTALATMPGALPPASVLASFFVGALVMRSAGCVINDLWDSDIDGKVARTKVRPLPSRKLSTTQAAGFMGFNMLIGLGALLSFHQLNLVPLAMMSMPLVVAYPLMKRYINWPQFVLGLTFNWGALLGHTALYGSPCWPVSIPLYISGICHTLVYDSIYAFQDAEDDKKIGMKSTALYFGRENGKKWLTGFSLATGAGLAATGYFADMGMLYYVLGVGGGTSHLLWQVASVNFADTQDCMNKFVSNQWFALLLFSAICLDKLRQTPAESAQQD